MVWLGAGMDAADGELLAQAPLVCAVDDGRWISGGTGERPRAWSRRSWRCTGSMTEATGGRLQAEPCLEPVQEHADAAPAGRVQDGRDARRPASSIISGRCSAIRTSIVVDGAIVPAAIGRNPSHTIAALAERIAAHVV